MTIAFSEQIIPNLLLCARRRRILQQRQHRFSAHAFYMNAHDEVEQSNRGRSKLSHINVGRHPFADNRPEFSLLLGQAERSRHAIVGQFIGKKIVIVGYAFHQNDSIRWERLREVSVKFWLAYVGHGNQLDRFPVLANILSYLHSETARMQRQKPFTQMTDRQGSAKKEISQNSGQDQQKI